MIDFLKFSYKIIKFWTFLFGFCSAKRIWLKIIIVKNNLTIQEFAE